MITNEQIIELSTRSGFYRAYFREIPKSKTNKEAYESVEDLYKSIFGRRKYTSYDSFRVTRDRWLSNK